MGTHLLEKEKVNADRYYSVGYSPALDEYILVTVVTDACVAWFNRYFQIFEHEYRMFEENEAELNSLADKLFAAGVSSCRFLCSDRLAENTTAFHEMYLEKIRPNGERR